VRRFALFVVPALLALPIALSFRPARDSIPGWGGDPAFNLWTFELVWHHLDTLGPQRVFSSAFWQAPLFGGHPLGLAFSENQIFPALLLWPLRKLTGNGALVLGFGAILWISAAFAAAAAWLRALGHRTLCWWGGLIFAGSGWLQSQYAHYQNLYVFVLPLALWSWARLRQRPGALTLGACALAFGWVGGWNLYFQVFANLILAVLAISWLRREPQRMAALLALVALIELPIAWRYVQASAPLGGFGTTGTYDAVWTSLLGSANRRRAFLPSLEVPIEAAGFTGVTWLVLMVLAARHRAQRPWLVAAAAALWLAFGHGAGLFDLLAALPGVSSLRAIGRAQVLFLLFSLPAVIALLETARPRWQILALAALMLELTPARLPMRALADADLWAAPTRLSVELAKSDQPVLVLPEADTRFMLEMTQSWTPYFGGYSGRAPAGEELLEAIAVRRPWSSTSMDALLDLTRATRVLALDAAAIDRARRSPRLVLRGCFAHLRGSSPCLFDRVAPDAPPVLRLDRDGELQQRKDGAWPAATLRATADGALDIRDVDQCRVEQTLHPPVLPAFRREVHLQGSAIRAARFARGQWILALELRQPILRLFRPDIGIVCR